MRSNTWSTRQTNLLIKEYPSCPDVRQLAAKIGKSYTAVKSRATVLKLKRTFTLWPKHLDDLMILHYPNKTVPEMSKLLGRSESAVSARAFKLRLKKTAAFKTEKGRYGRSLQGPNPNKGNRNFRIPNGERTQFKKGQVSVNTLYDGAIVTRVYHKNKRKYRWIRLNSKWQMLHVVRWTEQNGPVPEGHIIVFKNGDTLNTDPSNLECITLAENMKRHSIQRFPEELKELIILQTRIKRKLKKITDNG